MGFATHVAPHLVELGAQSTPDLKLIRTPYLHLDLLGMEVLQHTRGIASATGVHRHIDDLLLDLRRLTSVGILEQKGPPAPLEARTAPIALLAFRRQTMLDNIGPLAIGAVQHLDNHRVPHST